MLATPLGEWDVQLGEGAPPVSGLQLDDAGEQGAGLLAVPMLVVVETTELVSSPRRPEREPVEWVWRRGGPGPGLQEWMAE